MREQFIDRKFKPETVKLIEQANAIITEYQAAGFTLTLRQLYYQFVSRGLIPNKQTEYKRLGSVINDARLAGLIDWSAIEDRTRNLRKLPHWNSPSEILDACAAQYREDLWEGQDYMPEVWIEKDALVGVVEGVCDEWRVPYFACRGYTSQSEQYSAGRRFRAARRNGKTPVVLHLGDHDPSGIDMSRDNRDRLAMFALHGVDLRRLALNMEQVEEYQPPPNPAKETDSRSTGYIELYGGESWELDALEPRVISQLIEDEIRSLIDMDEWQQWKDREDRQRERLQTVADNWEKDHG